MKKILILVLIVMALTGCYEDYKTVNALQTWPAGAVTYQFSGGTDRQRQAIEQAMTELESYANVHFIAAEHGQLVITFNPGRTCAKLGYKAGKIRTVNFARTDLYAARHELLHVLGLIHEHQRPDRDQYIDVDMSAVNPEKIDQWRIMEPIFDYTGLEYDIDSIMHYYSSGHSISNRVVYTYQGQYCNENYSVSNGDIQKLLRAYPLQ